MAVACTGNLVDHFTLDEMASHYKNPAGDLEITPAVRRHAEMMEELRLWYNKPMKVNSWYRTVAQNSKVGGDAHSCHLDGIATDIAMPGVTAVQIQHFTDKWREICKKYGVIGGISLEPGWLHFDSNNTPTRYGKSSTTFRITDFR